MAISVPINKIKMAVPTAASTIINIRIESPSFVLLSVPCHFFVPCIEDIKATIDTLSFSSVELLRANANKEMKFFN